MVDTQTSTRDLWAISLRCTQREEICLHRRGLHADVSFIAYTYFDHTHMFPSKHTPVSLFVVGRFICHCNFFMLGLSDYGIDGESRYGELLALLFMLSVYRWLSYDSR